jgi:class 3 adenylate cyclase/tetratricopeptide (TPR) repeat protein
MTRGTIREWLAAVALEGYADLFEQHRIDVDVLPHLNDQDLKDLGIALGDRRRLLVAVQSDTGLLPRASAQPTLSSSSAASSRAERRQLTVLFCDLVGSTALSEALDPEELRALMVAYRKAASGAVERYAGYVAQHLGDGLMVYFGWPRAEEDAAACAVFAAIDVVAAVKSVIAPEPLHVRIGIATGPVVVGETGGHEGEAGRLAVGETPNLAARLQTLAGPDQIVITLATRRLAGEAFDYVDLGKQSLKGVREPQHCWRVEGRTVVQSRFEALHAGALSPLIGREMELGLVYQRWQQACDGDGQVVLLCGEPGIGKSRIVHALRERIGEAPHQVLLSQCSPLHGSTAFYPIVENLSAWAGITHQDGPAQKLDKLDALIESMRMPVAEVGPLFAAALSIPAPDRYPAHGLSPQRQRERTVEALTDRVIAFTRRKPLLFILEDAHWADPSTLDTLASIMRRVPGVPALVVVTHRPEFDPPQCIQPHVTALTLHRLGRRHAASLVVGVASGRTLSNEVLDQIIARTDGVPLFVEELTKAVLEAGGPQERNDRSVPAGSLPAMTVPATLRDSLMARLDRLQSAKEVAQIAACIGREFSEALLAPLTGLHLQALRGVLERLVASELVWRTGEESGGTYTFKHALVQEAAYASLLNVSKQQLHVRIAAELEANWPEVVQAQPELVAHHYASGDEIERAIDYLSIAGKNAIERSANLEAVRVLRRAIELLSALPETTKRLERELQLQTALAVPLMAVRVYSAPEVGQLYERSYELSRRLGRSDLMYPALAGVASFHVTRSELDCSFEMAHEMLRMAQADANPEAAMEAHRLLGMTRQWMGDLRGARDDFAQVLALYDPSRHQVLATVYGQDHRMSALCWDAWSLLYLGYPDQALATRRAALDAAGHTSHMFSRGYALAVTMPVLHFVGDASGIIEAARSLLDTAQDHGFRAWAAWGYTCGGSAKAQLGDVAGGLRDIEAGLELFRAAQVGALLPFHLALAADVSMRMYRLDAARDYLAEVLDHVERGGQRWFAAEAYRMHGILMLAFGEPTKAERHFAQAVEVARSQGAKGWELRAAVSYARLLQGQRRSQAAAQLLRPLCDWYTEGFGMQGLMEAKAILEEVEARP